MFTRYISTTKLGIDHFTAYLSRKEISIHVVEIDGENKVLSGRDIDHIPYTDLDIVSIYYLTEEKLLTYVQSLDPDLLVEIL